MSGFNCPYCSRSCKLNKKLSELRLRTQDKRIYFYTCDGANARKPHFPMIFMIQPQEVMFDAAGRTTFELDRVTRIIIEDGEAHEMLDRFKKFMVEERYKNLPKEENPAIA